MSEIKTDKLTGVGTAGDITVTSEGGAATMQLQQGLAKMWANLNGLTFGLRDSFNTSSATDHSIGNYSITQTSVFSNVTYACQATGGRNGGDQLGVNNNESSYARTTSVVRTEIDRSTSDNQYDAINVDHTRFGDLA